MPTSNQAMSVDGLDHVAHVDDLDLVNDAALADPLQPQRGALTKAPEALQVITTSDFTPYSRHRLLGWRCQRFCCRLSKHNKSICFNTSHLDESVAGSIIGDRQP